MNKAARITRIALIAGVLAAFAGYAAWWNYDPTVSAGEAKVRLAHCIERAFSGQARILEERSSSAFRDRIPFLVRWHPRYFREPTVVLGFPDGSTSWVIAVSGERFRCDFHFFRGRAAGFSVLGDQRALADAKALAGELRKAFPGLRVTVEESQALPLTGPTSGSDQLPSAK